MADVKITQLMYRCTCSIATHVGECVHVILSLSLSLSLSYPHTFTHLSLVVLQSLGLGLFCGQLTLIGGYLLL